MKITTYSGTVYDVKDITLRKGERFDMFEAKAARISDHAIEYVGRFAGKMKENPIDNTPEYFDIAFAKNPEVGKSWMYIHNKWGQCITSEVQAIEVD